MKIEGNTFTPAPPPRPLVVHCPMFGQADDQLSTEQVRLALGGRTDSVQVRATVRLLEASYLEAQALANAEKVHVEGSPAYHAGGAAYLAGVLNDIHTCLYGEEKGGAE